MPNQRWPIKSADGDFDSYLAVPEGEGPWPAVVVIQEIFGINAVMREACDRLADEGFIACCPDLFWRLKPGIELTDRTSEEWKEALGYMNRFDFDKGVEDIQTAITQLRGRADCAGKVGAVGYCMGGHLALLAATRTDADASVAYYGVGIENRLGEADRLSRPVMLHIAEEDQFVPKEAQAAIRQALGQHPQVTIHTYPGRDHAFARMGGAHYDEADAMTAGRRSLDFFKQNLG